MFLTVVYLPVSKLINESYADSGTRPKCRIPNRDELTFHEGSRKKLSYKYP